MDHKDLEGLTSVNDNKDLYNKEVEIIEQEYFMEETQSEYTTMQIMLPVGDGYGKETFIGQKMDCDGNTIVVSNKNPSCDSRVYNVQSN